MKLENIMFIYGPLEFNIILTQLRFLIMIYFQMSM